MSPNWNSIPLLMLFVANTNTLTLNTESMLETLGYQTEDFDQGVDVLDEEQYIVKPRASSRLRLPKSE